jgi:PTS system fructose-specific IIC component
MDMKDKNAAQDKKSKDTTQSKKGVIDHLNEGISKMLPSVIAGGIFMGLGYMLDDATINPATYGLNTPIAAFFTTVGTASFSFMLPVLSAGIAWSMAGTAAIAPGLLGGYLAAHGTSSFFGALLSGFFAGWMSIMLAKAFSKLPESVEATKNFLIVPLAAATLIGALSAFAIEPVMGTLNTLMIGALGAMGSEGKTLLGGVLGGMAASDMGGPVNKAAFLFSQTLAAEGEYHATSSLVAGSMTPPYATALATLLFPKKFPKRLRRLGAANILCGLSGITEIALPFLFADPKGVVLSSIVGGAVSAALSMAFGCSTISAFGGFFVLPLNSNPLGFLLSLGIGVVAGAVVLGVFGKKHPEEEDKTAEAVEASETVKATEMIETPVL